MMSDTTTHQGETQQLKTHTHKEKRGKKREGTEGEKKVCNFRAENKLCPKTIDTLLLFLFFFPLPFRYQQEIIITHRTPSLVSERELQRVESFTILSISYEREVRTKKKKNSTHEHKKFFLKHTGVSPTNPKKRGG